jgi:hypothetical protein
MTKATEHERAIAEAIPALAASYRARLAGCDVGAGPREGGGAGPSGSIGGTPVTYEGLARTITKAGDFDRGDVRDIPKTRAGFDAHRLVIAGIWAIAIGMTIGAGFRLTSAALDRPSVLPAKHLLVIR